MKLAARVTDNHVCPQFPHMGGPIAAGCDTVLVGGLPAARIGDPAICNGPMDTVAQGATNVLIGGMPAARLGDQTSHGGKIVQGCATVIIDVRCSGCLAFASVMGIPFISDLGLDTIPVGGMGLDIVPVAPISVQVIPGAFGGE